MAMDCFVCAASLDSLVAMLLKTNLFCLGWTGAPLSRFLEGATYKLLNE